MKTKLAGGLLIAVLIVFGFLNGEAWTDWLAARLWPSADEPVPTLLVHPKGYQVKVLASGVLTGFQTVPVLTPRVRGSLKVAWLIDEGSIVKPGDLLVRFDSTDAQMALEKNQNSVSSFSRQIDKSLADRRTEMQSLEKEREAAALELAFARNQIRRDTEIFSRWAIQESVVSAALAGFRRLSVEEKAAVRESLSEADLKILGIEKDKAQFEVDDATGKLSSLEVRAPAGGVVLHKGNFFWRLEVGREVWPGQPLMEVAALNQYQGNLLVVENDIAGVEIGKPVQFRLSALPGRTFAGRIDQIDGVPQQVIRGDPRKYFTCRVRLEVPTEVLETLKPGMYLDGDIQVSSSEAALVLPRSSIFKQESEFFVFAKEGDAFLKRPVKILDGDHGFYVVDGIEAGTEVCLRHPFEKEKLHLPDFNAPTAASSGRRFFISFN